MALSHIEAIAVSCIRQGRKFEDFMKLSSWLGCYEYLFPAERILHSGLLMEIASKVQSPTDMYRIWLASDIVFTSLTYQQQDNILSWLRTQQIQESNFFPTPRCLHYTHAPESSSSTDLM